MSSPKARVALVVGVLAVALAAGGWVLGQGFRAHETTASERLFDQVLARVADRYVDSIDVGTLYARAAAGMVAELGDPHSVFLDSSRFAQVQSRVSGVVGSLGLEVDARDSWVTVIATLPGTPAEFAGLRAGDRIVAIDGRATLNWTGDEARRALHGDPGTTVRVKVERLGTATPVDLTLERERVYVRPVQRAMLLEGDIGYVALRTFSDSAAIELRATIDSLYRGGMRSLVFDLRGNPGGLLSQGTAVADLFLNPGQSIVSLRGRVAEGRRVYLDEHGPQWKDLRVAVLVDRGTASASEIVAGALQDHDRALVIGRPTYGKGSAQTLVPLARDVAGLRLTIARWYTPSGRNIDRTEAIAGGASAPRAAPDSAKQPVYRTDSGRVVAGGGGIVPDIVAGDSVSLLAARRLFNSLGTNVRALRTAIVDEAKALAARGVRDPMFVVTPQMRDAVYARLERAGAQVPRVRFDAASDWIDRSLGSETVQAALGRGTEARRLVVNDRVVQEAVARLKAAHTTRELLAAFLPVP